METVILAALIYLVGSTHMSKPKEKEHRPAKFAYMDLSDTKDRYLVSSAYAGNSKGLYLKAIKDNTINKDSIYSCFNNNSSVNFIAFTDNEISNLRPYVNQNQYGINHRSVASSMNNVSHQASVLARNYRYSIRRLSCFKLVDGKEIRIVSEIYKKEEQ